MRRAIIIGGGVGPAAGLGLHRLILKKTDAASDQEHLNIIHMSLPEMIPDRTESLLDGRPGIPAEGMAEVIYAGFLAGRALGLDMLAAVPCNTFHAPPIWQPFEARLAELLGSEMTDLKLLNMTDETVRRIRSGYPPGTAVGILSTKGTLHEGIYSKPLSDAGFRILEPDKPDAVHELIYAPGWGIKAGPEVSDKARRVLSSEIRKIAGRGAELVVLGCTELPLAAGNRMIHSAALLDPVEVLAEELVKIAGSGENV